MEAPAVGFAPFTSAAYHADPCPGPSLSSSIASTLIRQSPFHAWLNHPKLGGVPREATPEMERGSIIHALTLGVGDYFTRLAFDNYRTKAAQEARDQARAEGKIPILDREFDDAAEVAESIHAQLAAAGIRLDGESELCAFWQEDTARGPVQCRGMMDHVRLSASAATILDLKTCRSAHPRACESHVLTYGYDIQAAAYRSAVERIRPELAGRVEFLWAFVEELPPGTRPRVILNVCRPSGTMRELGARKWQRACATWAECLAAGNWPAFPGVTELEAPAWALTEEGIGT